jgi:uncharacterized protein DUF4352/uncharacterized protein DUF2510
VSSTPLLPGLYPDPSGGPRQRYWDGQRWTGHAPWPAPKPTPIGRWIALSVLAVMVLFFGGCATLVAMGTHAQKTRSDSRVVAAPGEPVLDGNFLFVASEVSTPANGLSAPRPKGQWMIATVTVRNVDDEPHGFLACNQKLVDSQGHTYTADTTAAVAMNNDSMQIDMDPGTKVTLYVPFDVPPGTQPATVELHDSVFSGGARVQVNWDDSP